MVALSEKYDGMRFSRNDANGTNSFAWNGKVLDAQLGAGNTVSTWYTQGMGEYGDIISTRNTSADASSLQLYDASGNVSQTTDASANIIATLSYAAFGSITDNSGPANPTVAWQGKQGYQFEQALGLQYVRQRWYDPVTRQFISQDPLGFPDATVPWGIESGQVSGGDVNLYRYAGNNPINMNDPGGTDTFGGITRPRVRVPITPLPPHPATHGMIGSGTTALGDGLNAENGILHDPAGLGALHAALVKTQHESIATSGVPLPQNLEHALLHKPSLAKAPADPLARQIYHAELAYCTARAASPSQLIVGTVPSHPIGAPGFWASLIPIYGSGRAAINDYQTGHWGWGLFNTALAASDVLLVGDIYKIGAKLVVKGGAEIAGDIALKEALERSTSAGESTIIQRSQGVIVEKAGNYYVKAVDPSASGILRWYGRSSIGDQAKALAQLRELGVHFYYEDGKIITQDAGKFAGGYGSTDYWRIWAKGSWRLGTSLNDIRPRNIGAAGEIFDPAYEQHVKLFVNLVVRGLGFRVVGHYQPQGRSQ